MSQLDAARNTVLMVFRQDSVLGLPLAADAVIFKGGIVALDAYGFAIEATGSAGEVSVGIAQASVDATGLEDGDLHVNVALAIARLDNSANSEAIGQAQVGNNCYVVNDHQVQKTSSGSAPVAGKVIQVDDDGVWVYVALV